MVGTLSDAKQVTGLQSPVASDDLHFSIDQQRHVEAEHLNAPGNLTHLFFAVQPRVFFGSGFKRLAGRYLIESE
jgi:hypothetical protein